MPDRIERTLRGPLREQILSSIFLATAPRHLGIGIKVCVIPTSKEHPHGPIGHGEAVFIHPCPQDPCPFPFHGSFRGCPRGPWVRADRLNRLHTLSSVI